MLNYVELLNSHQGSMALFWISASISSNCKLIQIFILPLWLTCLVNLKGLCVLAFWWTPKYENLALKNEQIHACL